MPLRVYNTLSGKKEPFEPVTPGRVGMYLCGPTVYKPPHIGHLVGPVIFDAIKRYLTHKGYAVRLVVNVTDVDDKLIAEASSRGVAMADLAREQTDLYLDVLGKLGVRDSIDDLPHASQHMPEIIDMTRTLIEKNHAYAAGGDVWFSVSSDGDYGKLSHRKVDDAEAGLRDLQGSGKRSAADFALWKSAKPGEPSWDSPWGHGRPGWHIECSAMARKYLGDTFDIHGGGDDLKFPHHENELAQSECCTGKPLAKYWLHNGLTKLRTKAASGVWREEKMSKSLGNTVDAAGLVAKHGPDVVRYLLLSTHYRSPIEFTDEALALATKSINSFNRLFEQTDALPAKELSDDARKGLDDLAAQFFDAMDDDFNTGAAIGVLNKLANATRQHLQSGNAAAKAFGDRTRELMKRLGFFSVEWAAPEVETTLDDSLADGLMQLIIRLRADARAKKDFATADAIRNGLSELKITLEDKSDGTGWKKN